MPCHSSCVTDIGCTSQTNFKSVADIAPKIDVVFALVVGTITIAGALLFDQAILLFKLLWKTGLSRKIQFVVKSKSVSYHFWPSIVPLLIFFSMFLTTGWNCVCLIDRLHCVFMKAPLQLKQQKYSYTCNVKEIVHVFPQEYDDDLISSSFRKCFQDHRNSVLFISGLHEYIYLMVSQYQKHLGFY